MRLIDLLIKWNGGRLEAAQKRFGDKLGITSAAMSLYAGGKRTPTDNVKRKMAKELKLPLEELDKVFEETKAARLLMKASHPGMVRESGSGESAHPQASTPHLIPVLGTASAEFFRFSFDAIADEYIDAPHPSGRDSFALHVKGSHLSPQISNGDYLIVVKTGFVEDGQMAVIKIDDEYTLKRVYYRQGQLELRTVKAKSSSIKVSDEDASIIGRVTGSFRKI